MAVRDPNLRKFFNEVRESAPNTRDLEQGFEQRVLCRLATRSSQPQPTQNFFALAWQAVPVCALASLLLAAGAMLLAPEQPAAVTLTDFDTAAVMLAMY